MDKVERLSACLSIFLLLQVASSSESLSFGRDKSQSTAHC